MKTAIILRPTAASFQRIAGLPLMQRTVLAARRCGLDRIIVVGAEPAEPLHRVLQHDARTCDVEILATLPALEGSGVVLIASDCLLTTATLARVTAVSLEDGPVLFTSAGESLIALCHPAVLAGSDPRVLTDGSAAEVWAALQRQGAHRLPLDGDVCVRITDAPSIVRAEKALCRRLRTETAASDGPLAHRIDRHVSLAISRWLVRHTRLRPNHLTGLGTCVGLLAAAVLSRGTYWAGVAGTLLLLCTVIIDGCDGEVARLTFQESAFGQKFDVMTDNVVHVAIFASLAIGVWRQHPTGRYLGLLAILLGGFACTLVVTYIFLVRRPGFARGSGTPVSFKGRLRQWLLRGFEALMNRDFAYLLVLLALVKRLHWFIWGSAFGTYLFAILLVWIYGWRDAA